MRASYATFVGVKLDLGADATSDKLGGFLRQRLRGVLSEPGDVIDACVAASADDPYDVALRAAALGKIEESVRTSAGEVFKRAANIAKEAPPGELEAAGRRAGRSSPERAARVRRLPERSRQPSAAAPRPRTTSAPSRPLPRSRPSWRSSSKTSS